MADRKKPQSRIEGNNQIPSKSPDPATIEELERLRTALNTLKAEKEEIELINQNVLSHATIFENEQDRKLHDITKISETDVLTKIYNRNKIYELAPVEIERAKRHRSSLVLVIMDVDNFKEINDSRGHGCGDRVLFSLAQLIKGMIRQTDIFARWGGDEFIILSSQSTLSETRKLIVRIQKSIRKLRAKNSVQFTCSFGIVKYQVGDTLNSLIAKADGALYSSKAKGRNRISIASNPKNKSGGPHEQFHKSGRRGHRPHTVGILERSPHIGRSKSGPVQPVEQRNAYECGRSGSKDRLRS